MTLGFNLRIFLSHLQHTQLRFYSRANGLELGFLGQVGGIETRQGLHTKCRITLKNEALELTLCFEDEEEAMEHPEALEVELHLTHHEQTLLKTTVLLKDVVLQPQQS